jgi:hypothetical protein
MNSIGRGMNTSRMSRLEHVLTLLVFGSAFMYCWHGAVVGDLYLPSRRGGGILLHGVGVKLRVFRQRQRERNSTSDMQF